jgi:hypothetical protein
MKKTSLVESFLLPLSLGNLDAILLSLSELQETDCLRPLKAFCHSVDIPIREFPDHNIVRIDVTEFRRNPTFVAPWESLRVLLTPSQGPS